MGKKFIKNSDKAKHTEKVLALLKWVGIGASREKTPEINLWSAVLAEGILEAFEDNNFYWFATAGFRRVCDFSGYDPEWVRDIIKNKKNLVFREKRKHTLKTRTTKTVVDVPKFLTVREEAEVAFRDNKLAILNPYSGADYISRKWEAHYGETCWAAKSQGKPIPYDKHEKPVKARGCKG